MKRRRPKDPAPSAEPLVAPGPTKIWLPLLLLCVGWFVFVWKWVDPQLIYHGDMVMIDSNWWITVPLFRLDAAFFREFAVRPGGMVSYLDALASQFNYYPWVGALLASLMAGLLTIGTQSLIRGLRIRGGLLFVFVPALVLMAAWSSYFAEWAGFLSVGISLLGIAFYMRWAGVSAGRWRSGIAFVVLGGLLYWALGPALMLFALACSLYEWRRGGRVLLGLAYVGLACGAVISGGAWYRLQLPDLGYHFSWMELGREWWQAMRPAALYSALMLILVVWDWVVGPRVSAMQQRWSLAERRRWQILGLVSVCGAGVLVTAGLLDWETRTLLRVNYLARAHQWDQLLAELRNNPPQALPPGMLFDVNLALLETGQLGDRMFEFPQDPRFLIQVGGEAVPHRGCHELLLRLGCLNEAEHTAFEALEVSGPRPYLLRELALIHVAKGHPEAARVFLSLLSHDVIHGSWARERLVQLDTDSSFTSNEEVCAMRKVMMRTDQVALPNQKLFAALVDDNPANRAAMEYLMAYYLQTCQLDEVVKRIPELRTAGFDRLPDSYAAAILLYHNLFGKEPEMAGWTVSQAEYERFQSLMKLTGGAQVDPAAVSAVAAGTYYAYFLTRYSGMHETPSL